MQSARFLRQVPSRTFLRCHLAITSDLKAEVRDLSATLTWLDHDAADRDRMNRILALFRERDTRDELGIGVIRDLVADELFPGTSTIQTRLRYMLFVPWIYQRLEQKRRDKKTFADEARRFEVEIVRALIAS